MQKEIYTDNFENSLFDLLQSFIGKKANILLSGGSLLGLFSAPQFESIERQDWEIYFSDERLTGETNIDDARKNMSKFCSNFNDLREKKIAKIDIAILSVGEDGHVASLFLNHHLLDQMDDILYINDSPKEPKKRVTVSISFLNKVGRLVFMIPKKNGIVKQIYGPDKSICERLNREHHVYLDKSFNKECK